MLQTRWHHAKATDIRCMCKSTVNRRTLLRCHAIAGSAEAAAAAQPADVVQQLLTRRSYAPPRYVGPIQVSETPGKRYGLTATQNLPVGSLLLVVPPLVAAYGEGGAAPGNEELVSQLDGQQLLPWQMQWLRLLYRDPAQSVAAAAANVEKQAANGGSGSSADGQGHVDDTVQQQQQQRQQQHHSEQQQVTSTAELAMLQQLLLQGGAFAQQAPDGNSPAVAVNPAAAAAAAGGGDASIASITCPLSTEQLQQLISENAYSEPSEDSGASLLRELTPESVTGLWPEFALLNHSCAPNTVAVVVGQYLLLRATAPVLAGEELSCSYLGQRGLAPVALRRAFLQGVYGFHCQCARCMAEQSTFPTTYYPADNALLGIMDPNQRSSSSSIDQQQQQQNGGLLDKALGLIGLGSSSSSKGQQLQPSQQYQLLQQLHAESADLQAEVQEAVTADSRRTDRQLALLQQITDKVDALLEAVASVLPQLQRNEVLLEQSSPQVPARWLLAAAQPLLQLQVELIELLLASGQLPVDVDSLYDNVITGRTSTGSSSSSRGFSSSRMAAAGAAAAARLSLSRGSQKRQGSGQGRGLGAWVSNLGSSWGLAFGVEDDAGPVTKRRLLALYVDALECNLQVADAVARGSEVHIVLALKHMDAVRQLHGVDSDEVRLAEGLCSRAHAARYGVLPQRLLAALVSARRRQLLGASLARKMSVLAWEGAVAQN